MHQNLRKSNRKSIRLPGYDYAKAGAYFVTIYTKDRECLFGHMVNRETVLNNAGRMV
jgi:putative transposase